MLASLQDSGAVSQQDEQRALLATIREIDFNFRIQVKARIEEVCNQAGKQALNQLLRPEGPEAEQSVRDAKSRADAIAECLNRYISAHSHYVDAAGAQNTLRRLIGELEQLRDFQRGEAEASALKNCTGSESEVADGKLRKMAFSSYYRSEGTDELVQMLRTAFAPVLPEYSDSEQSR